MTRTAAAHRSRWSRAARAGSPPGPRGLPVVGSALDYVRDPLRFVTRVAERHGPIASIDMAGVPFIAVSSPELIHDVLVRGNADFVKGRTDRERRLLFGQGLATSDGALWVRQRRLVQPAFSARRFDGYASMTARLVDCAIDAWPTGERVDLHALIMRMALDVVSRVLLGADAGHRAVDVGERLDTLLSFYDRQTNLLLRLLPRPLRRPWRKRFIDAVSDLDGIVFDMLARKRRSAPGPDLLSALIAARDDDDAAMSERQLRDEIMTLFLAGHETTALTLSWTCSLLAQHPAVERRLADELDDVLGERVATMADLPRLEYAACVLKESMRVYPPAWILAREVARDVDLGGYRLRAGSFVAMSQWVMHRHPRYFEQPLRFRPERWLDGFEATLPKVVYFPFGAGARACIGARFATMEATIALAAIVRRFRFRLSPGHAPRPAPSLSLRPRHGVQGVLVPRTRRNR